MGNGSLEPSFGFTRMSENDNSVTMTTLGIGYLAKGVMKNNFNTYWGGRVSLLMQNQSSEDDSDGENAISLAPVYGAEYSFSENFSMGGEVQLEYFKPTDDDFQTFNLKSLLFFRFYF